MIKFLTKARAERRTDAAKRSLLSGRARRSIVRLSYDGMDMFHTAATPHKPTQPTQGKAGGTAGTGTEEKETNIQKNGRTAPMLTRQHSRARIGSRGGATDHPSRALLESKTPAERLTLLLKNDITLGFLKVGNGVDRSVDRSETVQIVCGFMDMIGCARFGIYSLLSSSLTLLLPPPHTLLPPLPTLITHTFLVFCSSKVFLEDSGDDSLVLGGRGGSHYHEDIIHLPKDAIRLWIAVDEFRELFAGDTNTTAATGGGGGGSMILRGRYGGGGGRDRDVTDVLDEQKRAESAWIINTYIDYEDFSAGAALTGATRKAGKAGETRNAAGTVTEASKANWGKLHEGISTPADKLSAKRRPVLFVKHICDDEMLTERILAGRGRPTKDMFAPLMEKVVELMQEKLLPLFFQSSTFTEYEVSDEALVEETE